MDAKEVIRADTECTYMYIIILSAISHEHLPEKYSSLIEGADMSRRFGGENGDFLCECFVNSKSIVCVVVPVELHIFPNKCTEHCTPIIKSLNSQTAQLLLMLDCVDTVCCAAAW